MIKRLFVIPAAVAALAVAGCSEPTPVEDQIPQASASADRSTGMAPLTVQFQGESVGGDAPVTFQWEFGDGNASTEASPLHVFTEAGVYDVLLRVTDVDGDTDEDRLTITATAGNLSAGVGAAPLGGEAPLEVTFSAHVTGGVEPYTYLWDFDDGTTAAVAAPTHVFTLGGSYDVQLTATDDDGHTATAGVTITVAGDEIPAATVAATPTAGPAPLMVAFRGGATGGDRPLTYSWAFGDGATSTLMSPGHVYDTPGSYDATLTVTDADGDADMSSIRIEVRSNAQPSVTATASPTKGLAPLQVDFQASVTGGDAPLTFAWDFGDGGTATGASALHTYQQGGQYEAVVTVTDATGDTDTASVTIEAASNAVPTVKAIAQPTSGKAPLTVSFGAQASGGNAPLTFSWTFGDGSGPSLVQNPSHTFQNPGSYLATVQVTDADGDTDSESLTITVADDDQPVLSASAAPTSGRAPLPVSFFASAQGGDLPLSYNWTFGDGGSATVQNPTHTYETAGTFQVQVVATDADGDADSKTLTIEVGTDSQPAARAFADPVQGIAPLKVDFSAQVTGGDLPLAYNWTFGDGGTSSAETPSHTYQAAGTYDARLTVTDADGDSDTETLTISVASNSVPSVSASASPSSGSAPLQVAFTAQSSGGDAPLTYSWTFGDGGTSTSQNPSHTYQTDGVFSATVVVTDANGDAASASVQLLVQGNLPDLTLSDLQTFVQGDQVEFTVTAANAGSAASPGFRVDIYTDRSAAPGPGDLGAWLEEPSLAAGESRTVGGIIALPAGTHTAWAQIDAPGLIAESDETNNVAGPHSYDVERPVLINEVRYDDPSTDDENYIEISGPPGTSLLDYALVGINGAGGTEYVTIDLSGETIPADGYFVVTEDATMPEGDLVTAGADLQNGPDSLQLRFLGTAVDALAYGTFSTSEIAAGEGTPALDHPPESSLGRDADGTDTDDNATDFQVQPPTPGAPNPTAGDSCMNPIQLAASGVFSNTTRGATNAFQFQPGMGDCGTTPSNEPDLVYAIPLLSGQELNAEITASSFDTILYMHSTCSDAASQLACNDDTDELRSQVIHTATADGTYYLVVDGYGSEDGDSGSFTLTLSIQ